MLFRILWGATKATLAATFWAVVFELAHHFGWYPEEQIAGAIYSPKFPSLSLCFGFPPQTGDACGETATAFHGPIKIIASGDDVSPVECEFDYYPDQIPAIVQRGSSQ